MTSTFTYNTDLTEFNVQVEEHLDLGFNLVDVEYADGTWFGTLRNTSGRTHFHTGDRGDLAAEFNKTKTWTLSPNYLNGYNLIDAEYGDGIWYSVYNNVIEGNSKYSYSDNFDDFRGEVQDHWDRGYHLIDIEYADGGWLATYGAPSAMNAYSSANNVDEFTGAIQQRWDEGYGLVDVEYADGTWIGVFNERVYNNGYSDSASLAEFESDIQDSADDGFDLIDVAYGDGTWFGVYSETIANTTYTPSAYDNYNDVNNSWGAFYDSF